MMYRKSGADKLPHDFNANSCALNTLMIASRMSKREKERKRCRQSIFFLKRSAQRWRKVAFKAS